MLPVIKNAHLTVDVEESQGLPPLGDPLLGQNLTELSRALLRGARRASLRRSVFTSGAPSTPTAEAFAAFSLQSCVQAGCPPEACPQDLLLQMRAAAVHVFLFAMPSVIERRALRQHDQVVRLDE